MPTTVAQPRNPALDEWSWAAEQAKAPRLRSMREFAEQEIVIPTGPYEGLRFRCDRQPFTRLWLDEIDSGRWSRFWATGPSQASKTLVGFNIPLLYHLFELRETVICGLPNYDMAADKWGDDILPAIEACPQFRAFLPRAGASSKGGLSTAIRFGNGAQLRFMTGGGGDKTVAGKTTRVLIVTEADGFPVSRATSKEADRISQLEARMAAWSDRAVQYGECTLSVEEGRTYQEITKGSCSRIVLPCPHCAAWVIPEREDVRGWEDAQDELTARENTRFHCPACSEPWAEDERAAANAQCRLVHRGQEITPDGEVTGPLPRTKTLGFRWTAIHNLLRSAADVGEDLWKAARDVNEDNAERKLCQFKFAVPYKPPDVEHTPLDPETLQRRVRVYRRGMIPEKVEYLTIGVDLGKRLGHYVVTAWLPGASGHIVDYGRFDIASDDIGVERATLVALRDFREKVGLADWPVEGGKGVRRADAVWIDSGWVEQTNVVYKFCHESPGDLFRPLVGRGTNQQYRRRYERPTKTGSVVRRIGEGYHISWQRGRRILLVEVNVDFWKSFVHERLASDAGAAGAMTLFEAPAREHTSFVKHLTAERQIQEFDPKRGVITRWETVRPSNHWLDAVVYGAAAGHFVGVRLIGGGEDQPKVVTDWFKKQKRA